MTRNPLRVVHARRIGPTLTPDRTRVLLRPFYPGSDEIARHIIERIMDISDEQAALQLRGVLDEFGDRHERLEDFFLSRWIQVRRTLAFHPEPSEERKALIGAYFLNEYSFESAALFNPSIVPHPDQTGLAAGALRFILSMRATGEGHISSITFREGTVSAHQRITRHLHLLRHLHCVRRPHHAAAAARDAGLRSLQVHHSQRPCRPEQGHGAFPTQNRRPLHHAVTPGR